MSLSVIIPITLSSLTTGTPPIFFSANNSHNSPIVMFGSIVIGSVTIISEIMVKEPITIPPTTTIGELCELFAEKNIGGVPVLKDDRVVGIITERDVLRAVKRI